MSYVRWSCDDHRSDVYVYEHCEGGYATHVAGRRYVGECPRTPKLFDIPKDGEARTLAITAWIEANKIQREWLAQAALETIGGPHDGASFHDETLDELLARLEGLRTAGYRVPEFVLDRIRWEIGLAKERAREEATDARDQRMAA